MFSKRPSPRRLCMTVLLFLTALGGVRAETVRVGYVLGFRSPTMNQDYRLAVKLLMDRVFKGFGVDMTLHPYEHPQDVLDAFWKDEIDVTELCALDYALLTDKQRGELFVTTACHLGESRQQKYLLLAPRGSDFESLSGKRILVGGKGEWNLGLRWLQMEAARRSGKPASSFLSGMELLDYENPSQCVLPTFFGKADSCLVLAHQFELLCDLNPQLKTKLEVVAESPDLLGLLFVTKKGITKIKPGEVADVASKIHTTASGQQAFTMMKITRMSQPEEADYESVLKLAEDMREHSSEAIALTREETE